MSDLSMIYKSASENLSCGFYNENFEWRILFDSLRSHHSKSTKSPKYLENTEKSEKYPLNRFDPFYGLLHSPDLPMIYGSNSNFRNS